MTTDEIRKAIRSQPFRPFTLRLASGQELFVDHPEFVALSKGGRTLAVFSTDDNAFAIIDPLLVEQIRFGANGSHRRKSA
jgi:hypothetical protein